MDYLILGVIIAAVVAYGILIMRRGSEITKLAHAGAAGQAKVTRKFRRMSSGGGGGHPCIRYEFLGPDGQRHENRIHVSEEVYESVDEGDPFDIVYLPQDPSINAARYMVNVSRKALKLPPI